MYPCLLLDCFTQDATTTQPAHPPRKLGHLLLPFKVCTAPHLVSTISFAAWEAMCPHHGGFHSWICVSFGVHGFIVGWQIISGICSSHFVYAAVFYYFPWVLRIWETKQNSHNECTNYTAFDICVFHFILLGTNFRCFLINKRVCQGCLLCVIFF